MKPSVQLHNLQHDCQNIRAHRSTHLLILLTTFIFMTGIARINAQAPNRINYQSVLRNTSGQLIINQSVGIKISILSGSPTGTVVYAETHSITTNAYGLATVQVGGGTVVTGTMSGIDWSAGPFYIKTETDPAGGTTYTISGTAQLLSVPYALYAGSGGSGVTGLTAPTGTNANGGSISGHTLTLTYADGTNPGLVSTGTQTFAGSKSFSSSVVATQYMATTPAAINAAATTTVDLSTGNLFTINVGANITTLTMANATASPQTILLKLVYSSGTAYTIAWPASFKWCGGVVPTLTCISGKTDIISIVFDGTTYFCSYALNY